MPPFLKNLAKAGNSIAKLLLTLVEFMVDIFHAKGHIKPACVLTNPLCQFHPKLPKFRHLFQQGDEHGNMNTEIAEQSFRKINKSKSTTKYMTPWRRMIFFKLLDYSANVALEKSLQKRGLMGALPKDETVHEALATSMTVNEYKEDCDLTYNFLDESNSSESTSKGTNSLCSDVDLSELSNSSLPSINIMEVDDDSTDFFLLSGESCEDSLEYLADEQESEKECIELDPNHWYEKNLTNSSLFANIYLEGVTGLEQLVPGRLFTTKMPKNIVEDPREKKDFVDKCKENKLEVICVLTKPHECAEYSGIEGFLQEFYKETCESLLQEFYKEKCGLNVYTRAIPDFNIPTSGALVNLILDLTYHLSQGSNCLIHCAADTGRTEMVLAAVFQNLGVYNFFVETKDQEFFLRNMPKAIDKRIIKEKPHLARAIAANHLIQLFLTHGGKIRKAEDQDEARDALGDCVKPLGADEESSLMEAYGETFDLIDNDGDGFLDQGEVDKMFSMCRAEIDLTKLTEVFLEGGSLTRETFSRFMCSKAKTNPD